MKRVQEEHFAHLFSILTCVGLMLFSIATKAQSDAPKVSGSISRVGDTTHLELKGRKDWKYQIQKTEEGGALVTLPALEEALAIQLQTWSCPLIESIGVNRQGPDNSYQLTIKYKNKNSESFDYQTDSPSALIFDFFQSEEDTKNADVKVISEVKNLPEKSNPNLPEKVAVGKAKSSKILQRKEYQKIDRSPAGDENLSVATVTNKPESEAAEKQDHILNPLNLEQGLFDASDKNYDRFRIKDYQISEDAIIASQNNIYIEFPMLSQRMTRFTDLMNEPPLYEVKEEETEENKAMRLLHALYTRNRTGAFMKTADFIRKKYPKTRYDEMITNMTAEIHYREFLKNKDKKEYSTFRSLFTYLIETYPDSPLTERNMMLLAFSALEQNEGYEALVNLQKIMMKYPKTKDRDFVQLGIAEAYNLINQNETSIKTYADLGESALDDNYGVEAQFRIGDVQFGNKDYKAALSTYQQMQAKYPKHKQLFAHAQYNASESEFWLKNYKNSLENYVEFVRMFPRHKYGGFALTRIGELLDILGAPEKSVIGAYTEGYYRFPDSPGSEVARLRLLSKSMPKMPDRELKLAVDEIQKITKNSKLPRIEEFTTLLLSEGFSQRSDYNKSLNMLLTYFQENPTTANLPVFRSRILRNISDILKSQIQSKKYIDALNFYGKYSTTWLKNARRIDTDFFQAFAYENAGAKSEAETIYKKLLSQLKIIEGTKEERERKVLENLPGIAQVQLRLAVLAASDRRYKDAFQQLREIKSDLSESENIERIEVGAIVAEQMNDRKLAIKYLSELTNNYKDDVSKVLQPTYNLARLELAEGMHESSENRIQRIEKARADKDVVNDDLWAKTLELKGRLLVATGRKLEAVETFTVLLDNFESVKPLSSIRYTTGKILFDIGDLRGAEKVWSGLNNEKSDFYYKLAKEKLSQAEWQDSFKKYIDRIPAAKDLK